MQSRTVFLFGVLFCVACAIVSTSAGGGGKWMEKMKKCGDGEINIEEAFKGKDECKENKSTEETRRRRSPDGDEEGGKKKRGKGKGRKGKWPKLTEMVCQWKKVGMLDAEGKFSESGAQEYVNKVYPEKYQAEAMTNLKDCADQHSSKFSMDNNCEGYKDFKKCSFQAHMKTCGIEWGKGKHKGKGGNKDAEASKDEE